MQFKEIPLEKITVRPDPCRTHNGMDGIEDLVLSIKALGLVNPIVVSKDSDGNYVIIDGQRRFAALGILNRENPKEFDKVECIIHENIDDDYTLKAMSLATNGTKKISARDLADAVNNLWNVYGDMNIVSRKFGISDKMISKVMSISVYLSISDKTISVYNK